jgi:hypothetical protein
MPFQTRSAWMGRRHDPEGIRVEADAVILAFRLVWAKAPIPTGPDNTTSTPAPVTSWGWIEPGKVVR